MPTTLYRHPAEPPNLPTAEYPDEVVERWEKEFEIAKLQMATGELTPMSAAEYAAKWGITVD